MIKTLAAANRSERERFRIPRSVQQSIPVQRIFRDGIWQSGGKFTQTWRFADINYSLASHEDQEDMFRSYCAVLNSLPTDATTKITINNRRLNGADFQRSVLMGQRGDSLDMYRREYNAVLTEKAADSNNLIQDKYITVSVPRKNVEEARAFFHRVDADLSKNLGRLDSGARVLGNQERLRKASVFSRLQRAVSVREIALPFFQRSLRGSVSGRYSFIPLLKISVRENLGFLRCLYLRTGQRPA